MELAIFLAGLIFGVLLTYLIAALAVVEFAVKSTTTEWLAVRQEAIEARRRDIRELENE
tara:strand:- start:621 stop:797 length:177 start_codon:yes stop_codon:yes gene_type:complete